MQSFTSRLKISTKPITLSNKDTAELLFGKSDLSQRGYKQLRSILLRNNVTIPTYENVRAYCNDLNVGDIDFIHSEGSNCGCMGVKTNFAETLQCIFSSSKLYEKMTFLSEEKQEKLQEYLCSKNPLLYKGFLPSKRTILLTFR